jgi:signal transduction histidine kinase
MISIPRSIAARLALGYGLLVAAALGVLALIFYLGTIGVFDRTIDAKITGIDRRLAARYANIPPASLVKEIHRLLADGIDSDTEVYLLLDSVGKPLAGNLSSWPALLPGGGLRDADVVRDGRATRARLIATALDDGNVLIVGRDLSDRDAIRAMVWRSLAVGAALVLLLSAGGAVWFRRRLESRIAAIRRTANAIAAGDLSRRIGADAGAVSTDEFGRLTADIDRMLDRIEHLVDGVRHVSNAIAHDLRTPLSRIRNRLADAVRGNAAAAALGTAAESSIADIDALTALFEKLLQIAEAESGMRPASFAALDLQGIARDLVELYEASAEEKRIVLAFTGTGEVAVEGDRNLIASALDNLIDNAFKYAGAGARIEVDASVAEGLANLVVRDDGPGIPAAELPRVRERFYRLDRSRHLPGNGLGLSIVAAIATLHRGALIL